MNSAEKLEDLNLGQLILKRVEELGYPSLMNFWQDSITFSYEYFRQIVLNRRVPNPKKIKELAQALKVRPAQLARVAVKTKMDHTVGLYYGLSPQEMDVLQKEATERTARKSAKQKREEKIWRLLKLMSPAQREQVYEFILFLRAQRKKSR